jgi:hypothetical protein
MTDTSSFTVEDRPVVSVWIHEKGRRGRTNDARRVTFLSRFSKSAVTDDDRRKLEKQEMYNVTLRLVLATIVAVDKQ